ncbi:MAG: hypothetical protein M5U34_33145 [Chloroflexi bacterium]|nr:hypothetical protein [Chloroflexota bacterium]
MKGPPQITAGTKVMAATVERISYLYPQSGHDAAHVHTQRAFDQDHVVGLDEILQGGNGRFYIIYHMHPVRRHTHFERS